MCWYCDCASIVNKVNHQRTCTGFQLVNRHTIFDCLLDTMPVDFLLGVDATNNIFVSVNHRNDVSRIPADVCVNKHQVGSFLLVQKAVCKSVTPTLDEGFVEHAGEGHVDVVSPHDSGCVDQ